MSDLIDDSFWIGHMQLGQVYEQLGENDLALVALTDAARLSGGNSTATSLTGYVFGKMGRANEAREVLRRLEVVSGERYGIQDPHRTDPRFSALLARCGFTPTAGTAPP